MPHKDKEARRLYNREYREKNKERFAQHYRKKALRRGKEIRAWFQEYKRTLKCNRCPENHPACLDFHHVNGSEKKYTVNEMVTRRWGRARILKAIEECEVLCANCHRKEHHDEREVEKLLANL